MGTLRTENGIGGENVALKGNSHFFSIFIAIISAHFLSQIYAKSPGAEFLSDTKTDRPFRYYVTQRYRLARLWDIISSLYYYSWFNLKLLSLRSIVNITFVHSFNHHFLFVTTPVLKTIMVRSKFVKVLSEIQDSGITSLSFFLRRWFRTTNWRHRSERKHFWQ